MADLTITTARTTHIQQWKEIVEDGMRYRFFSGVGVDLTEVLAAVALKQNVIFQLMVSIETAGVLEIYSAATKRFSFKTLVPSTFFLPQLFVCDTNEALQLKNPDGATMFGTILCAPIKEGQHIPDELGSTRS